MADGSHTAEPAPLRQLPLCAATLGTVYCVLSAVFYTLMGICQRELSTGLRSSLGELRPGFGQHDRVWRVPDAAIDPRPVGLAAARRSRGTDVLGAVTQLGGSAYQWCSE